MNISKDVKDNLTAVLKIQINKGDYEPRVEKVLEDYRKKARIDGFRPGKVPAGIVRKMYGKSIMADEINKLLSENLMKYIQDEKINILGEPLPSLTEQKPIDWENDSDFEFAFDLGLAPEFELSFTKKEKFTQYTILPDEKVVTNYMDNYARRYGAFKNTSSISDGKEMLKGDIVELNADGSVKEGGIAAEESTLYLEFIKDEEIAKKFNGLKENDTISFNIRKAFPNDVEISSILHIKKEMVASIDSDFKYTIKTISLFEKAEINQELFDKVYGEGTVTSEEQFKSKIEDEIKSNLTRESDYKFRLDAKNKILGKVNFDLPVEFLKRWIFSSNEGKFTMEQIDQDFAKFENDLKWQLIQNKIIKENDLKISDEEILEFAKDYARIQFEQYGLFNVPDEHIVNYAQESLKRDEERRKIFEFKYEDKVIEFVKGNITVDSKEISADDFNKLLEEK
jgi:trigger factor